MNSSILSLFLALFFTISQLWMKKIYWLLLVLVLWAIFFLSVFLPFEDGHTVIEKLVHITEGVFIYLLLVVFYILKYVTGPPIWKPIGYSDFKEKARSLNNGKLYVATVNTLLVLSVCCLIAIIFKKIFQI